MLFRSPEVILSRSHPNLVRRLFESEVLEIGDGTIEIRGIAREAGYRTKISVVSHDDNVDPVGACVGMRGARVKNIVRELNGEKVDILEWTNDPVQFVKEALSPVEPKEITVDEENKKVMVIVPNEKDLAKAIGRRGQNARLTSRLMGWDVQVRAYDPQMDIERQCKQAAQDLSELLGIEFDIAFALATMGGTSVDVLVDFEPGDIAENTGISFEDAQNIIEKARAIAAQ